ncbi:MAG: protein kinase [Planctomycetota bacterium]|nr:protein kinase [Planctomycetota bacterium]
MRQPGMLSQTPQVANAQPMRGTVDCPECEKPLAVEAEREAVCPHCSMIIPGPLATRLLRKSDETAAVGAPASPARRSPRPKPEGKDEERLPRRIKNYELLEVIGRGGMGTVYRARQVNLARDVALKIIRTRFPGEDEAVRFVAEAQVTGQIEHPNIVPVHEVGADEENRPYFVMKLVRGKALSEILLELRRGEARAQREYTLARLLHIFGEVCQAVAFAHSKGVLHRDLKPANIMIGDFGEVQVMDWGLAKVLGQAQSKTAGLIEAAPDTPPLRVRAKGENVKTVRDRSFESEAGFVAGTPEYMSPEQAAGDVKALSPRSDVYSLGAMLFEILHFRPPHLESDTRTLMRKIATEPVTWPREGGHRFKVSKHLKAVVLKALEMDPERRYASALALLEDVRAVREDRPVAARADTLLDKAARAVRRHGALLGTVAAALVLLSAGSAMAFWRLQASALDREKAATEREQAQIRARLEAEKAAAAAAKAQEEIEKASRAEKEKEQTEARVLQEAFMLSKAYPRLNDAEELLDRGQPRIALQLLEEAGQWLPPHSPIVARAYFLKGQAYRQLGSNRDAGEAIKWFQEAHKVSKNGDPRALLNCGDIAWRLLFDPGLAREFYAQAAEVDRNNPYGILAHAYALVLGGRRMAEEGAPREELDRQARDALRLAEKAVQRADFLWEAHYVAGTLYAGLEFPGSGLEDLDRAWQHFAQTLRWNPGLLEAWFNRAAVSRRMGRGLEASADLAQALRQQPDHAEALLMSAQLAVELGKPADALPLLERLLKVDPRSAQGHFTRGQALMALERWDEARAILGEALALDEKNAAAWFLRAQAHAKLERYAEAAVDAERAVLLDVDNLEALKLRAEARLRSGKYAEAGEDYKKLQERAPAFVEAWRGLGDARRAEGRTPRPSRPTAPTSTGNPTARTSGSCSCACSSPNPTPRGTIPRPR